MELKKNDWELRIEPTTVLSLKLNGKEIGRLTALCLDLASSGGLFNIPKVKLAIAIDAAAFKDDQKSLSILKEKLSKFKFLDITIYK